MDVRLTKQDWINTGLRTLAIEGASALKVGAMASALGVSRGSFYWHFKDFSDFRAQLLHSWRDRTIDRVNREFEDDGGGSGQLQRLVKRAFFGKRGLDRAIRMWAADEEDVAAMVTAVDVSRVAYMAKLLIAAGIDAKQARSRAAFIYWAYLGQAIVMDPASAAIDEAAMEGIADLFETRR